MIEPDIFTLARDFRAAREYIDFCLNPHSAPPSIKQSLTTNPKLLIRLLSELQQNAADVPLPTFSELPPPPIGKPDFNGVKLRQRGAFERAWRKHHEALCAQYERNKSEFERQFQATVARNDEVAFQRRVIERLRRDVALRTSNGTILAPERLNWIILEPSPDSLAQLRAHYENVASRHPEIQVEFSRIESVHALSPQTIYMGINEFDGYLVFLFRSAQLAVLECPIVGNALYLISGDWLSLSRLSKTELLRKHADHVERIIHGDTWLPQLKRRLAATFTFNRASLLAASV